jgi:hypothetical protein
MVVGLIILRAIGVALKPGGTAALAGATVAAKETIDSAMLEKALMFIFDADRESC